MRRVAFDDKRDAPLALEAPPISHKCPANGCPNAASVSFDHGARWACLYHAKAQPHEWPAITQWVRQGWPATANWNHPDKVAHEAKQATKRRAALVGQAGVSRDTTVGIADALSEVLS